MQNKRDEKPESTHERSGRNLRYSRDRASNITAKEEQSNPKPMQLMEEVVERNNMTLALKRDEQNKGVVGIDQISVVELRGLLNTQWPTIKEQLLNGGGYQPKPVRRVERPKPWAGMRKLGIPTVIDRLIQ